MSKYSVVSEKRRLQLIYLVKKDKKTIVSAAKKLKIKISTAKSILYSFEKNGKVLKKKKTHRTQKVREQNQINHQTSQIKNQNCSIDTVKQELNVNKQEINQISFPIGLYSNNFFYMDPTLIQQQWNFYQYYPQFNEFSFFNNS